MKSEKAAAREWQTLAAIYRKMKKNYARGPVYSLPGRAACFY